MQTSESSGRSASSASGSSDDDGAHPMDTYIAKRQKDSAGSEPRQPAAIISAPAQQSKPRAAPGSIRVPKALQIEDDDDDFEAALDTAKPSISLGTTSDATSSDDGEIGDGATSEPSSSGEESDDEAEGKGPEPTEPATRIKIRPVGVTILEEGEEANFNPEMARLLRLPR